MSGLINCARRLCALPLYHLCHPFVGVADGLLSSQKKALRDVKNTLQTHLKFGKEALKHNLKGSNIAPANHQGREASTEACSLNIFIDDSPEQFWDPCHCEADGNCCFSVLFSSALGNCFLHLAPISDGYPFLRMPNEYLSNEDISYLMRGLTGIPSSNYGYDSDSCSVNNNDLDKPFAFDRQDLLGWLFS